MTGRDLTHSSCTSDSARCLRAWCNRNRTDRVRRKRACDRPRRAALDSRTTVATAVRRRRRRHCRDRNRTARSADRLAVDGRCRPPDCTIGCSCCCRLDTGRPKPSPTIAPVPNTKRR